MSESAPTPVAAEPPARRSRLRRLLGVLLLLAVLAFLVWGLVQASRPAPDQLQGVVDTDQINVSTRVLSRVERLMAREGDQVQAGQTVALLSDPELEARNAQAEATLSSAKAVQARTENGDRPQDIASLQANWRSAEAQADLAAVNARRADNLFSEGVISAQRRDNADAARDSASQLAQSAREQYRKALAGTREEDKRWAKSQVAAAQAGLQATRSLVDETRLIAPVSGEIDKRFANPGELFATGVPLFTLIDLNNLWVAVNVREDEFHRLHMGQVLHGSVPALDLKDVAFRVDYISPQGDFATWRSTRQSRGYDVRSFDVHARPVRPVAGLRPGMSVLFPWPQK
jgi:HlyD family secretion protein